MAMDHEFGLLEIIRLQVVHIDSSIAFFFHHHVSILPSEEVLRTLRCWNLTIEWTQLETVELCINHNWWFTLYCGFLLESGGNLNCWLIELPVLIDFDKVRLFSTCRVRDKSE